MKSKISLAHRNVIILILSILPFFVGIGLSVYQSSDTEYLSAAINMSGSQRMRTMLISNYSRAYVEAMNRQELEEATKYKQILVNELKTYITFYDALLIGNEDYGLKKNEIIEIEHKLIAFKSEFNDFVAHAYSIFEGPTGDQSLIYVAENTMKVKDEFHDITALFQKHNDIYIKNQRSIDILMISFGAVVTIVGIVLSMKIRQKEYHATFDYLTGLKNRHSLFEDADELNINACSMFFIDLNKFKSINDTFGHTIGDEILIAVSLRLGEVFGPEYLYRYGGDEFIAILEDDEKYDTKELINAKIREIKRRLSEPIKDTKNREHFVGLSMGIVFSDVNMENWKELINLTDDLMYDSKTVSGNVIMCTSKKDLEERKIFSRIVDKVFSRGSISLNYQPIHSICNDEVCLYNVTSVWENGNESLSASEFIPILKRKGYLIEVDKNTILEVNKKYFDDLESPKSVKGRIKYIINMSEDTLRNYKLNGILSVLDQVKMPRDLMVIKIKEESLNYPEVLELLSKIKKLGFVLSVDHIVLDVSLQDKGKYDDIEVLKIGYALSRALLEKVETKRIMIEFIRMFKAHGKTIIIEGVERKELEEVIDENCLEYDADHILYSQRFIEY